jgi:hypothetical protein
VTVWKRLDAVTQTGEPLRINVADDDVWRATLAAVAAGSSPTVTYRCQRCGAQLAGAAKTPYGPLFIATWQVPAVSGHVLNGRRLTEREYRKRFPPLYERGQPTLEIPESTLALLQVPAGMRAEYPDLLVRCTRDGDAVLERSVVLGDLERPPRRPVAVQVEMPFRAYIPPRDDFGAAGQTSHYRARHRIL